MSLAFVDVDPVEIGAPLTGFLRAARDLFDRAAVASGLMGRRPPQLAMSAEEGRIRDAFDHMADTVGLSEGDVRVLCGAGGSLSRVVLALEFLGVALDLFGAPDAVAAWLRGGGPDALFTDRAPLDVMAAEGGLGVELLLLRLRTRLRAAQLYAEQAGRDRIGAFAASTGA
jgi:hypothetical protein